MAEKEEKKKKKKKSKRTEEQHSTSPSLSSHSSSTANSSAATPPRPQPPTAPTASSTASRDEHPASSCANCGWKIETNLLTMCEGDLIFCMKSCRSKWIAAVANDVIDGRTERMYRLKSVVSKRELLETVIGRGTSDAIVRIAVFMSQTARSYFVEELVQHEVALRHYVSYLKQLGQFEEAADLLDASGNLEEAQMLRLARMPRDLRSEEAKNRLANVRMADSLVNSMIKQQLSLADLHKELEPICKFYADQKAQSDHPAVAAKMPAWLHMYQVPSTLFSAPLMGTLVFVILFDQDVSGKINASKIRMQFNMADRHFAWICVQALSMLGMWQVVEQIVLHKSFLRSDKSSQPEKCTPERSSQRSSGKWQVLEQAVLQKSFLRSDKRTLPVERVARCIRKTGADDAKAKACIARFLKLIPEAEERFNVALELDAWEVSLDAAVQLKNRDMVIQLHQQAEKNSEQFVVTKQYIETPVNKWKDH